jgi:hypothetical protein
MTLRDWLPIVGALLIPVVIALGSWWITWQQGKLEDQRAQDERELAEQRAQDEALQSYLDQMGQLLLKEDLRNSQQEDISGTLARARTVTVLRSLDGDGKGSVLQFLYESGLITGVEEVQQPEEIEQQIEAYQRLREFEAEYEKLREASHNGTLEECYSSSSQQKSMPSLSSENAEKIKDLNQKLDDLSKRFSADTGPQEFVPLFGPGIRPVEPVVSLLAANLAHAELPDTELRGAYLKEVDLHSATLSRSILDAAILDNAVLDNADLEGIRLIGAHMFLARLRNTDLRGADLRAVQLDQGNLVGANLTHAYLFSGSFRSATLSDANLSRSVLTDADLSCANLSNANLSDADLSPIGPPGYKVPEVNDIKDTSGGEAPTTQKLEQT